MLIGQRSAETTLARALAQDRVSHAYLFVGPESVGKHTAAVLLAQALNCRSVERINTETRRHGEERGTDGNPDPTLSSHQVIRSGTRAAGDGHQVITSSVSLCPRVETLSPCGECEDCRRIAAGTHPDVHVILPGSKTGQNISVEQMRDLRQDVARRPILGRRKVYLIPTAEAMNDEAANTLLKTLEEPPGAVTLILMAKSPTRVLPTILSRCQVVRFHLAPTEAIREWLSTDGVPAETAAALALTAGGRPGLARRWSREPEVLARRQSLLELLAEIPTLRQRAHKNPGESLVALRLAERARALAGPEPGADAGNGTATPARGAAKRSTKAARPAAPEVGDAASEPAPAATEARPEKTALARVMEVVRSYYRDLLLLAQHAPEELIGNADALPALRAAIPHVSPADLVSALDAVDRCQQYLERNVAPLLALETLFLALLQPNHEPATEPAAIRLIERER
jgi:DNA polymerase III subunit delta'